MLISLAVLPTSRTIAESLADGPYVIRQPDGKWIARWVEGEDPAPRVSERRLGRHALHGSTVSVAAVGSLPAFDVKLREKNPIAADEIAVPADVPLFVVADTHGQFEILVELLQKHGVIDGSLRWSFGRGHLAILGDVFDRGPNHTEIFWLIYKLEAEAARARGGVHLVLGNHETLVLLGEQGHLNPKYPQVAAALGAPAYARLWSENTLLGRWLRTKASVLKLGSYLCLHGGISREAIDRKLALAEINRSVRDVLDQTDPYVGPPLHLVGALTKISLLNRWPNSTQTDRERADFLVMQTDGPLWYRGYFSATGYTPATAEDIDLARRLYAVEAILVGHTIVDTVKPLYGGGVIAVQVHMHRDESGKPIAEALRIERGRFYRARIDGTIEPL